MDTQADTPSGMRRGLRWLIVVLVIGVLGFFGGRAWVRDRYLQELNLRAQYLGPVMQGVAGLSNGVAVLYLGDSRMASWPDLPPQTYRTFNAGGYGELTSQVLQRAPAAIQQSRPKVIVIQAGINDLKLLGLGSGRDSDIERDCVDHLMAMIQAGVQAGALVVWTPIFPSGPTDWKRRLVWSPEIDRARLRVNTEVRKRVASMGDRVRVLDAEGWLSADLERHYLDTMHLKLGTYQKLQEELQPMLSTGLPAALPK